MDFDAYLNRIRYTGPRSTHSDCLIALQRAHLYSVPFENLDIHRNQPIRLGEAALFEKIVQRRRGGFCYELNGLFAVLLRELGYQVVLLSASSSNDDGSYAPEFDHLALQVHTPDEPSTPWLVDVGWGDGFVEPLRMLEVDEQKQEGRIFKITEEDGYSIVTELTAEGSWLKHYRYSPTPRRMEDFYPMCTYHQTSPESMFTQKRVCTIYTPAGRATLSNQKLIRTTSTGGLRGSEVREERLLSGDEEIHQQLKEIFGIDLSLD